MRPGGKVCVAGLVSFACIVILATASAPQIPSGAWAPAGGMSAVRAGASAVLLRDGRVLIAGGDDASAPLASAEIFDGSGFVPAAPMSVARSHHASVVLADGRVLVVGGTGDGGAALGDAEIYDPATDAWSPAGSMLERRSGPTATLLQDGRVVVAGGDDGGTTSATLEIFDPATGRFGPGAVTMSAPREEHAAPLLRDGRVLIVGGFDGTSAVAAVDLFDPTSDAVTPASPLLVPRRGHSATTLLDGTVLVAGGDDGSGDLVSAELLDPNAGAWSPAAGSLAAPRTRHLAFLLPHNNAVLIVGGTSGGETAPTAELFLPWSGGFAGTGSPAVARDGAAGSLLGSDGALLLAGGTGLDSTELYGFATVRTDKEDYLPGETVVITGAGWEPGETVTLVLHEVPTTHDDRLLTVTADDTGAILDDEFSPEEHDQGVTFYLTASGSRSQAQTAFTDSVQFVQIVSPTTASPITITSLPNSVTVSFKYATTSTLPTTGEVRLSFPVLIGPVTKSLASGGTSTSPLSDSIDLPLPACATSASYTARVTVFNGTGSGSNRIATQGNAVIISAPTTPVVSANPSGQSVVTGNAATFNAAADGSATLTVRWQVSTDGGATFADLPGVTTTTFTLASVTTADSGKRFRAVFTNSCGTATTSAATLTVVRGDTTTALTDSSPDPSVVGQTIAVSVAVMAVAPASGTPTGTVTVRDTAGDTCVATLVAGAGSCSLTPTAAGNQSLVATYSGDDNFNTSSSLVGMGGGTVPGRSHQVNTRSTATSVSFGTSPVVVGQGSLVTVMVTDTEAAGTKSAPAGTVTLVSSAASDAFAPAASCTLASSAPDAASCQVTVTPAAASLHAITASYPGSAVHAPGGGSAELSVHTRATAISVSFGTSPVVVGQGSLVTVMVTDTEAAGTKSAPAGTVTLVSAAAGDAFAPAASCTLASSGPDAASCQVTVTPAAASLHAITASYPGSAVHTSGGGSADLAVNRASTTMLVTSSSNPSTFGQLVTFVATVSVLPPGAGGPTGMVQFSIDGSPAGSPMPLSTGNATISTAALPVGSYAVAADYLGDGNFFGSAGVLPGGQTVTPAPTVSTLSVTPNPSQYSDRATFKATLSPANINGLVPATSVTFFLGSQNLGTVPLSPDGAGALTGALSVPLLEPSPLGTPPTGQIAPGSRAATAVFGGLDANFQVSQAATTLMIVREDARVTYSGVLFASTSGATSSTATVALSATVQDITVTPDAAGDVDPGDIRYAAVMFQNRDTGALLCVARVGVIAAGDTTTGTATCNWTANIGTQNSQSFTVGVIVGNYYTRNSPLDNTVVTVSRPLSNFITGGGYLLMSSSAGLKPADPGTRNNFGFNVKYNKGMSNLQGSINAILRNSGRAYQIKGNSMTSLAVQPTPAGGRATFYGKASIQDVTIPASPISIDGNATLQVTLTDIGEPGTGDTIGITLWTKTGDLWFTSNWSGTKTVEQALAGGNLVVH